MRRAITFAAATLATAVFGVFGAGPALAHECFVANRSAQGNAAVSAHSAAWDTITPEFLFGFIIPLTGDDFTCAVEAWNSNPDLPPYIVVGAKQAQGQEGVIAENNPNFAEGKASDGSGIDHAEETFGPAIGAIFATCGIAPPDA